MKKAIIFLLSIICFKSSIFAQPYIDIASVQNTVGPNVNFLNNNNELVHFNAALNIPIKLDKAGTNLILINPFYENWQVKTETSTPNIFKHTSNNFQLSSFGMPIGYLTTLSPKWSLISVFVPRTSLGVDEQGNNDPSLRFNQFGGFALSTYAYKKTLKFKFGLYFNKEYARKLILPLAGIDWRINSKNTLFGVLPDKMSYEHKVSKSFYYGAIFESLSSSFKSYDAEHFVRVDDNRLGAYADFYPLKYFVIRVETGHTLFRKIKTDLFEIPINDGFYCRIQANFRIRL